MSLKSIVLHQLSTIFLSTTFKNLETYRKNKKSRIYGTSDRSVKTLYLSIYRLGPVNLNTVNSNFIPNSKFIFQYACDLFKDQRIQQ